MRELVVNQVIFDPSNPEHRSAYVHFMNTSKWKIRFILRTPFSSVLNMILYDLSKYACREEGEIDTSRMTMRSNFDVDEEGMYDNHRNLAIGPVRIYERQTPIKRRTNSIIPIGFKKILPGSKLVND